MHCIGVDIVEISRIQGAVDRWGNHFLRKVFTGREIELYGKSVPSLAARFAGKEAVMKALDAPGKGIGFRDIEILAEANGRPVVRLYGKAQQTAKEIGISGFAISLSHSRDNAVAMAIGEKS